MKSLGQAYLSPQNRSLAQSFRYMRNKPTIIAFKTPSLENCEQRPSQNSLGSMSTSLPFFFFSTELAVINNFRIHSCIAGCLFAKGSRRRWHLRPTIESIQQWFALICFKFNSKIKFDFSATNFQKRLATASIIDRSIIPWESH